MKYDLPPSDRECYHRCRFKPETYEFGFLEDATAGNNKFTRKNFSSRLIIRDEFIRWKVGFATLLLLEGAGFRGKDLLERP